MGAAPTTGNAPGGTNRTRDRPPIADILFGGPTGTALRNEPDRFLSSRTNEYRPIVNSGWHVGSLIDSVELLCEAGNTGGNVFAGCDPDSPPTVSTLSDVQNAQQYLQCGADGINSLAERVVFADMPVRALDALRETSAAGTYPAVGGQYGAQLTALRVGLVELALTPSMISSEIRRLAQDIDNFRIVLARAENARELNELAFFSTLSGELTACLAAGLKSDWTNPQTFGVAIIACANSAVQIGIATRQRDIQNENTGLDETQALINFRQSFFARLDAMNQHATRMSVLLEQIDGALAQLENTRRSARNALERALFLSSDPADVHARANAVMRNRYDLSRERYDRAHRDAVRLAFMAKRAVEQRLGVPLSTLRDDLALVEAPARWEARVCELEGVDYARLRDTTALDVTEFADEFVGDYVTRLERVVQSYQVNFPFRDGTDTAVVSLRDDIQHIAAACETPVDNLLYEAGQLDVLRHGELGADVWAPIGCRDVGAGPEPNCASVSALVEGERAGGELDPFVYSHPEFESSRAYRVYFGHPDGGACSPTAGDCGLTADTAIHQPVSLGGGRYRLSWYGATATGESTLSPNEAVDIHEAATGASLLGGTMPESDNTGLNPGWTRYWHIFEIDEGDDIEVRIEPDTGAGVTSQTVDLAGFMLEDVTGEVINDSTGMLDPSAYPPGVFLNTGQTLTRLARTCEDTTGDEFRARSWRRDCQRLCPDGFGTDCIESSAELYCFWETEFTITPRDIEQGGVFVQSGFARGNYNYRIDSLAVNVVGTGVRDCEGVANPSTCHAAGFVPFTVQHLGPYPIRNVRGDIYDAPLFTARIEHGRALASERYITNPVSSADRALIGDYIRAELRGRPLSGTFVLRIWDESGLSFNAIEDVQLVLDYRYWTRSE